MLPREDVERNTELGRRDSRAACCVRRQVTLLRVNVSHVMGQNNILRNSVLFNFCPSGAGYHIFNDSKTQQRSANIFLPERIHKSQLVLGTGKKPF
jgi:hypothetical protein